MQFCTELVCDDSAIVSSLAVIRCLCMPRVWKDRSVKPTSSSRAATSNLPASGLTIDYTYMATSNLPASDLTIHRPQSHASFKHINRGLMATSLWLLRQRSER